MTFATSDINIYMCIFNEKDFIAYVYSKKLEILYNDVNLQFLRNTKIVCPVVRKFIKLVCVG